MKDKSEFRPLCRTDFAAANKLNFPPTICIPFQHYIFFTPQQDDFSPHFLPLHIRTLSLQKYLYFAVLWYLGEAECKCWITRPPFARPTSFRITSHASSSTETAPDTNTNKNQIQVQILVFNHEARSPFCSCCSSHQIKCLLNTETLPNTNRNTSVGSQSLILPAARPFSPSLVRKMYKIEKTKTVLGLNAESTVRSIWILN